MSRALSCFGFALCLAGVLGSAHKPISGANFAAIQVPVLEGALSPAAPIKSKSSYPTRTLDLHALALSDFGDEEK